MARLHQKLRFHIKVGHQFQIYWASFQFFPQQLWFFLHKTISLRATLDKGPWTKSSRTKFEP